MPPPPSLDSVLSFSNGQDEHRPTNDEAFSDDAGFEFAFDLFGHGRIVPAYPVFDRHLLRDDNAAGEDDLTAPPSPDTCCTWAPRSAPGSPAREGPFPKSASTGEARRFWRLRDLVGGRSHSDGKEKFVFLQPAASAPSKMSGNKAAVEDRQAKKPSLPQPQQQKQSKKKGRAGAATEMDMATAHKLFYGKPGAGGDRRQHSFLPYRSGIVGFFAAAHALGRSHHSY